MKLLDPLDVDGVRIVVGDRVISMPADDVYGYVGTVRRVDGVLVEVLASHRGGKLLEKQLAVIDSSRHWKVLR